MSFVTCPYCHRGAKNVTGKEIYPSRPSLHELEFWWCEPCDAHARRDEETLKTVGTMANRALRKKRRIVYKELSFLWGSRVMKQKEAYKWFAKEMGMTEEECRIANFDEDTCNKALVKIFRHHNRT